VSDKAKVIPYASFDLAANEDKTVTCDFFSIDDSPEMVNHPKHYNDESGVECCEVTDFMMFNGGNCFKYLYRAGKKGSTVEDLKKAAWYAKRAGELEECTDSKQWAKALRTVFKYREGNIYKAMVAIRYHWWARVEAKIEAEIARLESE
tara:strand:- start:6070 stop:6516 length:447 start_codon:yes stop_codon:yes gene_type:complete